MKTFSSPTCITVEIAYKINFLLKINHVYSQIFTKYHVRFPCMYIIFLYYMYYLYTIIGLCWRNVVYTLPTTRTYSIIIKKIIIITDIVVLFRMFYDAVEGHTTISQAKAEDNWRCERFNRLFLSVCFFIFRLIVYRVLYYYQVHIGTYICRKQSPVLCIRQII